MTKAVEGRGVQSVEVGARIRRALVELGAPAILRDVATKAAVAFAQALAYLVSFRNAGLVEQDPSTGRYPLGPFALQLQLSDLPPEPDELVTLDRRQVETGGWWLGLALSVAAASLQSPPLDRQPRWLELPNPSNGHVRPQPSSSG